MEGRSRPNLGLWGSISLRTSCPGDTWPVGQELALCLHRSCLEYAPKHLVSTARDIVWRMTNRWDEGPSTNALGELRRGGGRLDASG